MTVEQIMGKVVEVGPPTEKKRLVKVLAEGKQYPKSLRCWQTNQDGSPSTLWPKVQESFDTQREALFIYKIDNWTNPQGEARTSNIISEVWLDETEPRTGGAVARPPAGEPAAIPPTGTTPATAPPPSPAPGGETPPHGAGSAVARDPSGSGGLAVIEDIKGLLDVLSTMLRAREDVVENERGWADWTS